MYAILKCVNRPSKPERFLTYQTILLALKSFFFTIKTWVIRSNESRGVIHYVKNKRLPYHQVTNTKS